ncbi:pyrroline-5-carboxylate reductase [Brachybacterium squillarum]|uniref:pyrroline-5-carboxylate reductase n=1 Tax=Brachybacterium squillarum TaxID=661979 RepID=UPI002223DB08|nr:pyrroline-5-carboxylate reductase [Brachybacterium squillarum]MCW1804272.1 pyrroline-5-carboxylate reductase [Brachybacterium squillarum]
MTSSATTVPAPSTARIAVIGAGNMGGPVVRTFLAAGARGENVHVANSTPGSSERAAGELGVTAAASRSEALAGADLVVLGVKPYQVIDLLGEIADELPEQAVVLSLAAGVTLEAMEGALPAGRPVVRSMPSTPIAVGEGAVGLMRGASVTDEQYGFVEELFSRAGVAVTITEDQVHAFIGAAGSLVAVVYALLESMTDEAVRQGLKRDLAAQLVQQTVRGAATVLTETGVHAAVAKNAVTSPGGTTAEALAEFERQGVRGSIASAMQAAADRSRAMTGD